MKQLKIKQKNKKADFSLVRNFNATSSFNKFCDTKYYQNGPKFNGVYSRHNLHKIKDGSYLIILVEFKSIGPHWIALYMNRNCETYFFSFRVKISQKKLQNS